MNWFILTSNINRRSDKNGEDFCLWCARQYWNLASKGKTIEVWGDSNRVKDMVYVKDFCRMPYKAVFADRAEGYYNVGTGIGNITAPTD